MHDAEHLDDENAAKVTAMYTTTNGHALSINSEVDLILGVR